MKIRSTAYELLTENFEKANNALEFIPWIKLESENGPGFYRWLFDNEDIGDFGSNMTEQQRWAYEDFIERLEKEAIEG